MVKVHLWSGLRRLAGDAETVTVEAATVGQMLDALVALHPGLKPIIEGGVAVAIDGEITNGGRHLRVNDNSEIHLLQQMKGG